MMKRKHCLVVEMTTNHPLTERDAAKGLRLLLRERLDLQAKPIWGVGNVYCEKLTVKEFSKVATLKYLSEKLDLRAPKEFDVKY